MSSTYCRRTTMTADEKLAFNTPCLVCHARSGEPCEMQGDHDTMRAGFHRARWEARMFAGALA